MPTLRNHSRLRISLPKQSCVLTRRHGARARLQVVIATHQTAFLALVLVEPGLHVVDRLAIPMPNMPRRDIDPLPGNCVLYCCITAPHLAARGTISPLFPHCSHSPAVRIGRPVPPSPPWWQIASPAHPNTIRFRLDPDPNPDTVVLFAMIAVDPPNYSTLYVLELRLPSSSLLARQRPTFVLTLTTRGI